MDDPFGTYNLTTNMGGAELVFELNELLEHPGWRRAWLQFCKLQGAPKEVVARDRITGKEGGDAAYAGGGRLAGYVYLLTKNPAFAQRAWAPLLAAARRRPGGAYATRRVAGPQVLNPIDEAPGVSTNSVAQSSLHTIELLEMCGNRLAAGEPPV